jgi:predicted dehydrogenase/NADPH:quinone reductase-like Zn-dependent oxidoreductase
VDVAAPGPDQVTVAVEASVVSTGTERAAYAAAGTPAVRLPFRPGYSSAGIVVGAGRRSGFAVGDRVAVIAPHASLVTVDATAAFHVPDGLSLDAAAFVQLGVIARLGVAVAGVRNGESVCVIGSGVIGALALRLVAASGASKLTTVARTDRRAAIARMGGATAFLATSTGADVAAVRADVVIDSTGDPGAFRDAVSAAADGGRVVLLGSPRGVTRDVPIDEMRRRRITVLGAHVSMLARGGAASGAGGREARAFLEQLAAQEVRVEDLTDVVLDPRETPAFYRSLPSNTAVTVARIDWSRMPSGSRVRGASMRPPDLRARGVAAGVHPRPLERVAADALAEDPLAGATGMLGVALLGCGDIGEQNAAAIHAAPNARLVACYDPVPALASEVAGRFGAGTASSIEGLLANDAVDAVFLAVPHDLHGPLAVQAAVAGRHVIIEKPLAQSLAAAQATADAVRAAGVSATVCFPQRYDAGVRAARRLVDLGALGELRGTLTTFLADKPPAYWQGGYSGRSLSDWRASKDRAGGGVLIMNLSHHVDVVLHLCGLPIDSVTAFVSPEQRAPEIEDSVTVAIRYANGSIGTLCASSSVPGTWEGRGTTEMRIWGSSGHLSLDETSLAYTLTNAGGLRPGRWHQLAGLPKAPLRTAFISRFATAVSTNTAPDIGLDEALAVQAFIEAVYLSASQGGIPVRPADLFTASAAPTPVGVSP